MLDAVLEERDFGADERSQRFRDGFYIVSFFVIKMVLESHEDLQFQTIKTMSENVTRLQKRVYEFHHLKNTEEAIYPILVTRWKIRR